MPKCEHFYDDIPEMEVAVVVENDIVLFRRNPGERIPPGALRSTMCMIDAVCTGLCDTDEEYCGKCGCGVNIRPEREVLDSFIR